MKYFEQLFKDGTSLRLLENEFELAKKRVLWLRFECGNQVAEVPLWNGDEDVAVSLRNGLTRYLKDGGYEKSEKRKVVNQEAKSRFQKTLATPKICEICGETYQPAGLAQKYCSKCKELKKSQPSPSKKADVEKAIMDAPTEKVEDTVNATEIITETGNG